MNTKKEKKTRVYFSMSSDQYEKFQKYITENLLDQSKVIEKLIKDYVKNRKNIS